MFAATYELWMWLVPWLGSGVGGAILLLMSRAGVSLPEWLFPMRGRWLQYLLRGAGSVLLLFFAAPLVVLLLAAASSGSGLAAGLACLLAMTLGVALLALLIAGFARIVERWVIQPVMTRPNVTHERAGLRVRPAGDKR